MLDSRLNFRATGTFAIHQEMARKISQETFDNVAGENKGEFDLGDKAALEDSKNSEVVLLATMNFMDDLSKSNGEDI